MEFLFVAFLCILTGFVPVGPGLKVVDRPEDALRCAKDDLLAVLQRENDRLPLDGRTDCIKPEPPARKGRFR